MRRWSWLFVWCLCVGLGISVACSDVLEPPSDGTVVRDSGPTDAIPDVRVVNDATPDASGVDIGPPEPRPSVHTPYEKTWYGGAVMYQIFVRSFFDSNQDGIGDLNGITAKLDYLNSGKSDSRDDLKIEGIWLTPIFKSGSYHGYDTQDYKSIDPVYGTTDDLKGLLQAAHSRGIKVILDLVINHTSSKHPWFQDASSGENAAKRGWYVWRKDNPGWKHPFTVGGNPWFPLGGFFYYAVFSPGMPDLNLEHKDVIQEIKQIMRMWLELGVDGFRFDAIRYFIAPDEAGQSDSLQTHALLKEFSTYIRSVKQDAVLVGEAWTTTQEVARYFGDGDEVDLCFQFDLVDAIDRAFQRSRASGVRTVLAETLRHYREMQFNAPLLGNHDHKRVISRLLSQVSAVKLASVLLLTLPGTPFVYYGEEIGLGASSAEGDLSKRAPMQWDDSGKAGFSEGIPWNRLYGKQTEISVSAQQSKPGSLLQHYRQWIRLRRQHPALRHGQLKLVDITDTPEGSGLAYLREHANQRILLVLNFSETQPLVAHVDPAQLPNGSALNAATDLQTNGRVELKRNAQGHISLPEIPPHGALMLELP